MDRYLVKKPMSTGYAYRVTTEHLPQDEMIEMLAIQFEGISQVCNVYKNGNLICIFNVRSKGGKKDTKRNKRHKNYF